MKSLRGLAYKSSETPEGSSYDFVADEYYNERFHPTCADFRSASYLYLKKLFELAKPSGRLADIGCGRSLVAEFRSRNLVLVDSSPAMLQQNAPSLEKRCADVERESIGESEFDWAFAILGDPYNSIEAWRNIGRALKVGGQCVFVVPSETWVRKFRSVSRSEKANLARFLTSNGRTVFLRSLIVDPVSQEKLISGVGLVLVSVEHVSVGDLPEVRSPKISEFMSAEEFLLDIYRVKKI